MHMKTKRQKKEQFERRRKTGHRTLSTTLRGKCNIIASNPRMDGNLKQEA
jgi:hypothetical protein